MFEHLYDPFPALLDTSVLFPPTLRDTLLYAAARHLYRPFWSEGILEELARVLVREGQTTEAQAQRLVSQIRGFFPEAMIEGWEDLASAMRNDEGDRHVLAAAVRKNVSVIVTANTRHFLPDAVGKYNIEIKTPDDFLTDLFDLYPAELMAVLHQQAASKKKPPLSVPDVLARLARTACTKFVARAEAHRDTLAHAVQQQEATAPQAVPVYVRIGEPRDLQQ